MFSIPRPHRRLKLATLAAFAVGAASLALTGAVQASADDLGPFSCTNRSGGVSGAAGTVTAIRIALHDGYDRLVLGFATSNTMPQYKITQQATSHFVRDASGQGVSLDGSAGLRVVLQNTDINTGVPSDLKPQFPEIREVTQIGNFERVTSYGVGLATAACFRVLELSSPTRLVIDVATPATAATSGPTTSTAPAQASTPSNLAGTGQPAEPIQPSSLPLVALAIGFLAVTGGTALVIGRRIVGR